MEFEGLDAARGRESVRSFGGGDQSLELEPLPVVVEGVGVVVVDEVEESLELVEAAVDFFW
jgi:hypothetical protein